MARKIKTDLDKIKSYKRDGIFMLIAGILLLTWCIWSFISNNNFMASAKTTEGKVVKMYSHTKKGKDSDGHYREETDWDADVEYVINGKHYTKRTDADGFDGLSTGDIVKIYYQENDPEDILLDKGKGANYPYWWIGAIGLVVLGSSFYYFRKYKKATT